MKVLHLTPWQEKCGIAGYAADLTAALTRRGVRNDVHALNRNGRLFPLAEEVRAELEKFRRRAEQYDVVHIQHEFSFFCDHTRKPDRGIKSFGSLLAELLKMRKPVAVTYHTEPHPSRPLRNLGQGINGLAEFYRSWRFSSLWRRMVRRFFRRGSHFAAIVHTHKARATLVESGFDEARVRRIPIGLTPRTGRLEEIGQARARQLLGYPPEAIVLSLFGFISAHKGHVLAAGALRRLPAHYHLAIIGGPHPGASGDSTLDDVLKLVDEYPDLKDRVRITGFVPPETVDLYHAATSICLAPYRNFNSSSAGITWALTSGRPVVASSIPTFVELQDESECLLLFTENAEHELAWHVQRLAADPRLQKELVQNAAAYAERYSWDRVALETIGLYQSLIGKPSVLPVPSPKLRVHRAA